jgi:hypothetical protein
MRIKIRDGSILSVFPGECLRIQLGEVVKLVQIDHLAPNAKRMIVRDLTNTHSRTFSIGQKSVFEKVQQKKAA